MKLSEVKSVLKEAEKIAFQLPNGALAPNHFHVTEVGKITKKFIDCGGTIRHEEVANFQLWNADDYDHRLHPEKLLHIIELAEKVLNIADLEIEVEYQSDTIGKFGLSFNGTNFVLINKQTDCLAKDNCGIPNQKTNLKKVPSKSAASCSPNSGCC